MATDFRAPIEKFLTTKVQEYFPDFDLREGTAFRDMVIKPMAIFLQPYRDQVNVLKRNQSLANFELMAAEELDALVANVFIARRSGTKATGSVRVYLSAAQQVSFSTDVQFQTSAGLIFYPTATVGFTAEQLALNTDGLYFYCDVPCTAELAGTDYNVAAHQIVFISGGPAGVVKVDNLAAFALGVDSEDNATLARRAQSAITVRDLVTKRSISAALLENFTAMREVAVVGFGDPEMQRDVMNTVLDLVVVIDERLTGEISGNGTVFTDRDDVSPINFLTSGVRPGHSLRIFSGQDAGLHLIRQVTTDTVTLYDTLTVRSDIDYGFDGIATIEDYHVGGKVDVYIDTTRLEEGTFYLDPADELNPLAAGSPAGVTLPVVGIKTLIEVDPATHDPLTPVEDHTLWPEGTRFVSDRQTGTILIDGGICYLEDTNVDFAAVEVQGVAGVRSGFKLVITDEIDAGEHEIYAVAGTGNHRLRLVETLTARAGVSYRVIASDYRLESSNTSTRLSSTESLSIRLLNTVGGSGAARYYVGATLAATFYGDSSVADVQTYIDNEYNRVVAASVLARRCLPTFVDLEISYRGTISASDLEAAVAEYINGLAIGATFEASDLVATLYFFEIDYIQNDFLIKATTANLDGTNTYQESSVTVSIPRTSKYIARSIVCSKLVS
ncbi:MAG: baseplate J/gp47 family protein [Armatimonadia bacterium]